MLRLPTHPPHARSDFGADDILVGGFLHRDVAQCRHDIQLICTSFDDEEELFSKYPESRSILRQLSRFDNVQVLWCQAEAGWILAFFPLPSLAK
jgi:hypothetical protein